MPQDPNKISQFWQELKRRKVLRVITIYAAVAFVILQLVEILAGKNGLLDHFGPILIDKSNGLVI